MKGRYFHAGEQARSLAILLSNRPGVKMYSTIAPMMGLPLARQAQRLQAKKPYIHIHLQACPKCLGISDSSKATSAPSQQYGWKLGGLYNRVLSG